MEIREFEIPDYGIVKVSEFGDVYGVYDYSKKRKASKDKDGYYKINFKYRQKHVDKNGIERKYISYFVHRLVAICFVENPNEYPVVNHKDGNKQNNHYSNLEWCTSKQNHEHAILNKLDKGIKGTNNPKNKLSEEDVLQIRKDYDESSKKRIQIL